jgi:hypothetical protein
MFMVFWGSSCRETAKNAIKKIEGKRRQEKEFGQKLHDFPQQYFCGVFELPLLRNAPQKKGYHGAPFSGHLPDIRRFKKKSSAPFE